MFFFSQFDEFDPFAGHVPAHPFTYLPEISQRARALLKSRSKEQVTAAAKKINKEIEGYFSDSMDAEIYRLKSEMTPEEEIFHSFFEWDGGSQFKGRWLFKAHMADELGIPTEENTSEVDALKAIIESRDSYGFFDKNEPPQPAYSEGKDYELFAVLSLWLVADSLSFGIEKSRWNPSISGEFAIKAMDAVCYAEHLRDVEWLISHIKTQSQTELKDALLKQRAENVERVKYFKKMAAERAQQRKREISKELNKVRHKPSTDAKKLVTEKWEKSPHQFPSAEKAGLHYAAWLEKQNIGYTAKGEAKSFQPRAVTGWIRDHAKKLRIKFR